MAKPFLKWAGGKRQLLGELLSRIPEKFNTYYEPFLGGGALFFALCPKRACLSDVNTELVNAYQAVKEDTESLLSHLQSHKNTETYYYELRNVDREATFTDFSPLERASRIIYLNKTCYNGLYRVNSKGHYNVPYGFYKRPRIADRDTLTGCAEALKQAELATAGFQSIEARVTAKDFVYFDPPYVPLSNSSSFTNYSSNGFGPEGQIELKELCDRLSRKKVKFMLSNSYTDFVLDAYKDYNIDVVHAGRAVNSIGSRRGKIKEVIVRNY